MMYQLAEIREHTEKTLERNLVKGTEDVWKFFKHLRSLEFVCEPDARALAERWIQSQSLFRFLDIQIGTITHRVHGKRVRPSADELCITRYTIVAEVVPDEDAISDAREKLGRFILATNDHSVNPDDLLAFYKDRGAVEQGFRFLKDKSFRIAEIFLNLQEFMLSR